jgi:hypothetical protein
MRGGPEHEPIKRSRELEDFRLRMEAGWLAIPQESVAHPMVRDFLSVRRGIRNLQAAIDEAMNMASLEEDLRQGDAQELVSPWFSETGRDLSERYDRAHWLLTGADRILGEGFRGYVVNPKAFGRGGTGPGGLMMSVSIPPDMYGGPYPVEFTGKLHQWREPKEPERGLWFNGGRSQVVDVPDALPKDRIAAWLKQRPSAHEWRSELHKSRVVEEA